MHNWWHWEEAPWHDQLMAIIECLHTFDIRMQCILDVVKQVSIPWSLTVTSMVDAAANTDHPRL